MATNDFGSAPATGANEMGEGGESVRCLHIYEMSDGSFKVEESSAMAPEEAESVADLGAVMAMVESTFAAQEDPDALAAAQKGYGKPREMQAPNPGGLFGE